MAANRCGSFIHRFFYVIKPFAHALIHEKTAVFVENDRFFYLFNSTFWCCFDTIIKKLQTKASSSNIYCKSFVFLTIKLSIKMADNDKFQSRKNEG